MVTGLGTKMMSTSRLLKNSWARSRLSPGPRQGTVEMPKLCEAACVIFLSQWISSNPPQPFPSCLPETPLINTLLERQPQLRSNRVEERESGSGEVYTSTSIRPERSGMK